MATNANRSLPPTKFTSVFTRRLARHPLLAYYPYPRPFCGALVSFMIDQLLVSEGAAGNAAVATALTAVGATFTGEKVFNENEQMPNQQIQIWRLSDTSGSGSHADVANAVWTVRPIVVAQGFNAQEVAPNHVLIPAPNYHDCPWGPPDEHGGIALPPREPGTLTVAVIDSGYLPQGPIDPLVAASYGWWLEKYEDPSTGATKYKWEEGSPTAAGANPFDQNNDGNLDALVGHANFVAGIVAQVCAQGSIVVESHNGAFVEADAGDPAIPTEASVARSLWDQREADVIHVGFAFPTLPDIPVAALSDPTGPPSWALQVVLDSFRDRSAHFVVAPAGNQGCTVPQFPAAFSASYTNVIGVGSVNADGDRSKFSNHGSWVNCCTQGQDVVSTFIDGWSGPTEEAEPPGRLGAGTNPSKEFTGWASWSGTSFAAPKVTGALARLRADGKSMPDAWAALTAGALSPPDLKMGYLLEVPMP
jgi:Subtilase family